MKGKLQWLIVAAKPLASAAQAAMLALLAGASGAAAFAAALQAGLPPDVLKPFVSLCRELLLLPHLR